MATKTDKAVAFFRTHAGYSYDPKTETKAQGRARCARALAQAERDGSDVGLSFRWRIDQNSDSSSFQETPDPYQLWECLCYGPGGNIRASLGGIDFGRDGEPWGDPYRRVVEAELASEAL